MPLETPSGLKTPFTQISYSMNPCGSLLSVASIHPSQTSPQVSSCTRCRFVGGEGGVKSLLGWVVATTVLLVLLFNVPFSESARRVFEVRNANLVGPLAGIVSRSVPGKIGASVRDSAHRKIRRRSRRRTVPLTRRECCRPCEKQTDDNDYCY